MCAGTSSCASRSTDCCRWMRKVTRLSAQIEREQTLVREQTQVLANAARLAERIAELKTRRDAITVFGE